MSLIEIKILFIVNKLTLNDDKIIRNTFALSDFQNFETIINPHEINFLGISLEPSLIFVNHTEHLADRLYETVHLLRNPKHLVPFDLLLKAFHALFQSVALHAILNWSTHSMLNEFSNFKLELYVTSLFWNIDQMQKEVI